MWIVDSIILVFLQNYLSKLKQDQYYSLIKLYTYLK